MTKHGDSSPIEQLDVLIIGAGISGIGAAYYLQRDHPSKTFAILEARDALGGTWDLFRYPGIRSDSDLHTFGYEFKPWRADAIAGADKILAYLNEAAAENGIDSCIRYGHKVVAAEWSSSSSRWTVDIKQAPSQERTQISAKWVFLATGYYRYDEGFTPTFPGRERFAGRIVHPQHWPSDLDYADKKVVVIGSGATAVTLLPAMADTAAHVTMLQRSPTYVLPLPSKDIIGNLLVRALGSQRGFAVTRRKNIAQQRAIWLFCQRFPSLARRAIRHLNAAYLPKDYPVDTHFNPTYNPWEQRVCLVPDGDLFKAIGRGDASVVTDRIAEITETGISLESGAHLDADIIVTATGLNLQAFGGIPLTVDDAPVSIPETVTYKGMMLTGVPNLAFAIGYTNSSWTLKVGLLCEHFCRLLSHMDENGYDACVPQLPDDSENAARRPFLDFSAGYIQRSVADLPRQGESEPWVTSMSYHADVKLLRADAVEDNGLRFSTHKLATTPADPVAATSPLA